MLSCQNVVGFMEWLLTSLQVDKIVIV